MVTENEAYIMNNEQQAKIVIVAKYLKASEDHSKASFARDIGISPRTLGRYVDRYSEEAKLLISREVNMSTTRKPRNERWDVLNAVFTEYGFDTPPKELFEKVNELSVKAGLEPITRKSFNTYITIARKAAGVGSQRKSRNGRQEIIYRVLNEHGADSNAAFLHEKANQAFEQANIDPLTRSSFYAMLSVARKVIKTQEAVEEATSA